METAEPFLTFILEIAKLILTFIADLAWPAVIITMFLLLRHPIKALISRIKRARVKKDGIEYTLDLMGFVPEGGPNKRCRVLSVLLS